MEQEKQTTVASEAEKTLVSPRFDEEAISHARPAVPLDEADALLPRSSHLRQAASELTSSRLALVLVLISMLASGVIGALVAVIYQRNSAPETPATPISRTNDAPEGSAQTARDVSDEDARDAGVTRQRTAPVTETNNGTPVEFRGAEEEDSQASPQEQEEQRSSLRAALDEWIATTNARDLNRQKEFYMPKVSAFYRARNVSRDEVLADKGRAFENADLLNVRAVDQPEINIHPNGRMATMRFRKQYAVRNGQQDRRGEVLQELRWRRTGTGWKIVSERDVRVIQ
jgi:ketosteroid isomerase-like protein